MCVVPSFQVDTSCSLKVISSETKNCGKSTEYFELFFDEKLRKLILEQSNLYAFHKNRPLNMSDDLNHYH